MLRSFPGHLHSPAWAGQPQAPPEPQQLSAKGGRGRKDTERAGISNPQGFLEEGATRQVKGGGREGHEGVPATGPGRSPSRVGTRAVVHRGGRGRWVSGLPPPQPWGSSRRSSLSSPTGKRTRALSGAHGPQQWGLESQPGSAPIHTTAPRTPSAACFSQPSPAMDTSGCRGRPRALPGVGQLGAAPAHAGPTALSVWCGHSAPVEAERPHAGAGL